jgi:glycosyltransferase involved in cell wall biosynthesis
MKISIITPVFNEINYMEKVIDNINAKKERICPKNNSV